MPSFSMPPQQRNRTAPPIAMTSLRSAGCPRATQGRCHAASLLLGRGKVRYEVVTRLGGHDAHRHLASNAKGRALDAHEDVPVHARHDLDLGSRDKAHLGEVLA